MADQGESFEGETNGAGEAGGVDKLASSFEKFQSDVMGRFDSLSQRIPEPEPYVDEANPLELDLGDFGPGDVELTDAGGLTAIEELVRRAAVEQVAGLQGVRDRETRLAYANELEAKYPALQDETVQDEMISKTIAFAREIGRPEMAMDPRLLERIYLAHEAERRSASEVPAGRERGVTLERGSAAGAGGLKQEDEGDRIVAAFNRGKFRLGAGG